MCKASTRYKLNPLTDEGQIHTRAFSYLKVAPGCSFTPPAPPSAITLAPIPDNKARVVLSRQDLAMLFRPSAVRLLLRMFSHSFLFFPSLNLSCQLHFWFVLGGKWGRGEGGFCLLPFQTNRQTDRPTD